MAEDADVPGAVADQREGFLGDAGEDQFPFLSIGEDFFRLRVDHLGDEMIFVDVHAGLRAALEGNAGA